jgi:hypothetical protein
MQSLDEAWPNMLGNEREHPRPPDSCQVRSEVFVTSLVGPIQQSSYDDPWARRASSPTLIDREDCQFIQRKMEAFAAKSWFGGWYDCRDFGTHDQAAGSRRRKKSGVPVQFTRRYKIWR